MWCQLVGKGVLKVAELIGKCLKTCEREKEIHSRVDFGAIAVLKFTCYWEMMKE